MSAISIQDEKINKAINIAVFIITYKCTIRDAAEKFGISKTTAHRMISKVLPSISSKLYYQVREVIDNNKEIYKINNNKNVNNG